MRKTIILLALTFLVSVPALAQPRPPASRPARGPASRFALPAGVTPYRNVEYVKNGGYRRSLDLFVPDKPDKPMPLIIWVHGGGWSGGSKEGCPAIPFLALGYSVASINYRLTNEATFPAQIEDCKTAVRWLRAHAKDYRLDPDRFGAWGASAGGHLVALLGTSGGVKDLEGDGGNKGVSSRVQAVCDWFGPTDLMQMLAGAQPLGKAFMESPNSPLTKLIGGPLSDNKEKVARANPITFITADDPPFLIMHGDRDPLVPLSQSQILADALKKAGIEVTLVTLPGAGHGGGQFTSPENRQRIVEFFSKHLMKADASPK